MKFLAKCTFAFLLSAFSAASLAMLPAPSAAAPEIADEPTAPSIAADRHGQDTFAARKAKR